MKSTTLKRYLVIFSSHPVPPADATAVDVRAAGELSAIAKAKRVVELHHPWSRVVAVPWPRGLSIDEATATLAAS